MIPFKQTNTGIISIIITVHHKTRNFILYSFNKWNDNLLTFWLSYMSPSYLWTDKLYRSWASLRFYSATLLRCRCFPHYSHSYLCRSLTPPEHSECRVCGTSNHTAFPESPQYWRPYKTKGCRQRRMNKLIKLRPSFHSLGTNMQSTDQMHIEIQTERK